MKSSRIMLLVASLQCLLITNHLTYIHTSHLDAVQIHWLSDLMLFDFEIKYRAGKSNQVADALSRWPVNPKSSSQSSDDEEEWEAISSEMVCQIFDDHLDSTKLPYKVKLEVQNNIADVNMANQFIGLNSTNLIDVQLSGMKCLIQSHPAKWLSIKRETPSYPMSMST